MIIKHIDDVLPLIEGRKDFVIKRDPLYTAIDYQIQLEDTFADPLRAELRGIKFHPDGRILARPLHKFFNYGEQGETQSLNNTMNFLAGNHSIMTKLDGSMVHGVFLDGQVRLMTRMGLTDVAAKAEELMTPEIQFMISSLAANGFTAIFEFTSPDNQIVIKYPEPKLTLLQIRNNVTGEYESRSDLAVFAKLMNVGLVEEWDASDKSLKELVAHVKDLKGEEGIVIHYHGGDWIKIKADEYVLMHKSKESIRHEKNVLAVILDGLSDDLLALLTLDDKTRLLKYRTRVVDTIVEHSCVIHEAVKSSIDMDQKTFALMLKSQNKSAWYQNIAFAYRRDMLAGKQANVFELAKSYMRRKCGSQTDVDSIRDMIGVQW